MERLITHALASAVSANFISLAADWPLWDSEDHPQEPQGSGKFPFNYNGDYATERVLIVSGRATLTPDDGSPVVTLEPGDSVFFHHGFACQWTVHERMTKRYNYFDADGQLKAALPAIACDGCGCDCEAESYLVGDEDFCPRCHEDGGHSGEHQKFGVPVPIAKPAKKSAGKKKAAEKKKAAPHGIRVVPNFGGKRCAAEGPASVHAWGVWDCDPEDGSGRAATQKHGYGKTFPWHFDMLEKAYVVEGSATLTADDPAAHGEAVTIAPRDMVTFPKGWRGRWEVHSFLSKRYAFFDHNGIQVDEDVDEEEDVEDAAGAKRAKH
mmetsp:Transcript_56325/g.96962  ORF Transcript_56325/g.96962 Transcript_56325/m.96962 type:complete len:323 (-) Transcript_56325:429-1397(-)